MADKQWIQRCENGHRLVLLGFLGTLLLLSGCTQPATWSKPGATQSGFDRDMGECRRQQARQSAPMWGTEGGSDLERYDKSEDLVRKCMEKKGYTLKKTTSL